MSELVSGPGFAVRSAVARPPQSVWPRGAQPHELALDALWIIFFFFGSSTAYSVGRFEGVVWLVLDLVVVVAVLLRLDEILPLARRHAIFLAWGVLATISFLWSLSSGFSLYHGLQLIFTVLAGMLLLTFMRFEHLLRLLFVTLVISALFSLFFTLANPTLGTGYQESWQGAYPHKNVFGMAMVTLLITGACLAARGWRPLLCLCGMALATFLLIKSRSGTCLISATVTMSLFVFAFSYRFGVAAAAMAVGVLVAGLAVGGLVMEALDMDFVEEVLNKLGKDSTLSGRTLIWDLGTQAYESRPWLGHGFEGYWRSGETSANYLRYLMQQMISSFHNNFLEVAVAFGFMGPVLLVSGLCIGFYRVVRAYLLDPVSVRLWSILILVHIFILCFAEVPLFANHGLYQVLLIAAVASADESEVLS